jgi:hypothetical protein
MNPVRATRTARFASLLLRAGRREDWIEELIAFDDQVGLEDRSFVEGMQRGAAIGSSTTAA